MKLQWPTAVGIYTKLAYFEEYGQILELNSNNDLSVFVLVTMAKSMEDVTVNLQGPLVFNIVKKLGLQFIIPEGKYSTRHSLFGDKIKNKTVANPSKDQLSEEKVN